MKYMMLIYSAPDATPTAGFEEWMSYDKAMREAGVKIAGDPLGDVATATTVRVSPSGERTVTDGPFAETREVLGGYYVIDVPDLDAALEWAGRCPGSRDGWVTVRPIVEM